MHNREGLTLKRLWIAICDYDLWPLYIMYGWLLMQVCALLTLPLILAGYCLGYLPRHQQHILLCLFGTSGAFKKESMAYYCKLNGNRFNTFTTNLLTIPSTVAGMFTMFAITLISETVNDRSFVSMAEDVWTLPFLVAIYLLPAKPNQWLYFVSHHRAPLPLALTVALTIRVWHRDFYPIRRCVAAYVTGNINTFKGTHIQFRYESGRLKLF